MSVGPISRREALDALRALIGDALGVTESPHLRLTEATQGRAKHGWVMGDWSDVDDGSRRSAAGGGQKAFSVVVHVAALVQPRKQHESRGDLLDLMDQVEKALRGKEPDPNRECVAVREVSLEQTASDSNEWVTGDLTVAGLFWLSYR